VIVIADTSPINYLIPIGEIEVLPALYQRVLVPPSVAHLDADERDAILLAEELGADPIMVGSAAPRCA
jgi:predicted nucleic acid-binding protein